MGNLFFRLRKTSFAMPPGSPTVQRNPSFQQFRAPCGQTLQILQAGQSELKELTRRHALPQSKDRVAVFRAFSLRCARTQATNVSPTAGKRACGGMRSSFGHEGHLSREKRTMDGLGNEYRSRGLDIRIFSLGKRPDWVL
jgi:hypothetical protein